MSELINNSFERKRKLKELILKLHEGGTQESVRQELLISLSNIPYGEVVEVEQELISEGLPEEEILDLCDAHSAVLEGRVDLTFAKTVPPGHPVDVIKNENKELEILTGKIYQVLNQIAGSADDNIQPLIFQLRGLYNNLYDVDKLYQRKEYLLFPFLER